MVTNILFSSMSSNSSSSDEGSSTSVTSSSTVDFPTRRKDYLKAFQKKIINHKVTKKKLKDSKVKCKKLEMKVMDTLSRLSREHQRPSFLNESMESIRASFQDLSLFIYPSSVKRDWFHWIIQKARSQERKRKLDEREAKLDNYSKHLGHLNIEVKR